MRVVVFDKLLDLSGQLFHAPEGSTPNCSLSDEVEPDLHLIQPRGVRGGIVDLVPRMSGQPSFDLLMLMS